jgi:hypothetical protein
MLEGLTQIDTTASLCNPEPLSWEWLLRMQVFSRSHAKFAGIKFFEIAVGSCFTISRSFYGLFLILVWPQPGHDSTTEYNASDLNGCLPQSFGAIKRRIRSAKSLYEIDIASHQELMGCSCSWSTNRGAYQSLSDPAKTKLLISRRCRLNRPTDDH